MNLPSLQRFFTFEFPESIPRVGKDQPPLMQFSCDRRPDCARPFENGFADSISSLPKIIRGCLPNLANAITFLFLQGEPSGKRASMGDVSK